MRPLGDGFLELAREQADRRQARAALAAWDRAVAAWRAYVLDPRVLPDDPLGETYFAAVDRWADLTDLTMSGPATVAAGVA